MLTGGLFLDIPRLNNRKKFAIFKDLFQSCLKYVSWQIIYKMLLCINLIVEEYLYFDIEKYIGYNSCIRWYKYWLLYFVRAWNKWIDLYDSICRRRRKLKIIFRISIGLSTICRSRNFCMFFHIISNFDILSKQVFFHFN